MAMAYTGLCTSHSGVISSHLFVPRNKYYSTYKNSVPEKMELLDLLSTAPLSGDPSVHAPMKPMTQP